jgi:hypothetical protein
MNTSESIQKLTVVSAIFDASNENEVISQFMALKQTNICVVLCASPECHQILKPFCNENENVILMPEINIHNFWIYQTYDTESYKLSLPDNRNLEKDTETYILHRHAKHECMEMVIRENPWKTTHFVWVDFHMMYMCKNMVSISNYLNWLNTCNWRDRVLTMTGGWTKLVNDSDVLNSPYWRFCGVFIGDSHSILEFCELYKKYLPVFLEKHRKWVWEFNVWAWMEKECGNEWNSTWYQESPNTDELLMCSSDHYTKPIQINEKINYMKHDIPNYFAGSSCYLYYQGNHFLNTRFVNYWIAENGYYVFHDKSHKIQNKNIISVLNSVTLLPDINYEMNEHIDMDYPLHAKPISVGLEDIRLFEYNGQVKYIATTIGYTSHGKPRIIMGDYDIGGFCITNGNVIEPPIDTYCEKNWIPLVRKNPDSNEDELLFIYKWHPMQIGKIIQTPENTHSLEIIENIEIDSLIFHRIRGSTSFHETDRGLLGVVHYSEQYTPRHYYHMFVLLDKDNFNVLEYSNTFCFEKLGIEFCIGFMIMQDSNYMFWISRHDRDPCALVVSPDQFVFTKYM